MSEVTRLRRFLCMLLTDIKLTDCACPLVWQGLRRLALRRWHQRSLANQQQRELADQATCRPSDSTLTAPRSRRRLRNRYLKLMQSQVQHRPRPAWNNKDCQMAQPKPKEGSQGSLPGERSTPGACPPPGPPGPRSGRCQGGGRGVVGNMVTTSMQKEHDRTVSVWGGGGGGG